MEWREWVRREVRREFEASVSSGIGRWPVPERSSPDLGEAVFECLDGDLSLTLYSNGLEWIQRANTLRCHFREIEVLHLAELRDAASVKQFGVTVRQQLHSIEMSPELYSTFSTTISHVLAAWRAQADEGVLERELKAKLRWWPKRYALSRTPHFLDLAWDGNMTIAEMDALDAVVMLDSRSNSRMLVTQRIRGEIRYWLATHRDPIEMSHLGKGELGSVASVEELVSLCEEFLFDGVEFDQLSTPRMTGRGRKGRGA